MTTSKSQQARELYRTLGTLSLDDMKAMMQMNLIKNNSVTTEDINLTSKAFGLMLQQSRAKLQEQTQHQLSVILWKCPMNYWKLIRTLPFQWMY